MCQEDSVSLHSNGLPWWLFYMRPQGYLGRSYAARYYLELGFPERLNGWDDTHVLRALMAHGHDVVGNLLLGDITRTHFSETASPAPVTEDSLATEYVRLAQKAASSATPGTSAGGEQPKFIVYTHTPDGPRHVIVKFSERENNPVSERCLFLGRVKRTYWMLFTAIVANHHL